MVTEYSIKLKDPRWQRKRLEILDRDEWTCQICHDSETTLAVHHRRYLANTEPWDYPNDLLITLCEDCHEFEREYRPGFEKLLLEDLRLNFFADDLRELALGFSRLKLLASSSTVARAYCSALISPEIQRTLIEKI